MGSFNWLTDSNRWKHLVCAIAIGLLANTWYCAEYTGVGVAACLWLPMIDATAEEWQFLVFLSFVGIAILAVSPYKDSDFNYKLHYIGTCIAMVAVLSLWAARGAWVVPIAAISAGLALRAITDKWLLWVELIMFALAILYR